MVYKPSFFSYEDVTFYLILRLHSRRWARNNSKKTPANIGGDKKALLSLSHLYTLKKMAETIIDREYLERLASEFGITDLDTLAVPGDMIEKFYKANPDLKPIKRVAIRSTPAPAAAYTPKSAHPKPAGGSTRYISQEEQARDAKEHRIPALKLKLAQRKAGKNTRGASL